MQTYPPGTHIGQYEIASLPMMGGMGVVYFALDHGNDGRPVALKTFRPEFLPDRAARDRFLREGTAWIELGSHPHIVRCYKVEYIDPTAFLVLELIAKEQSMPDASLRSWLIPGHPLPLEQALLFALQIARGMQYATEKISGFVHRDLKPENILVGADKLPGTNINRLRVTDFGLVKTIASGDMPAKVGSDEELKPSQVQFTRGVGTPLYMAPEQWKGKPVGVFTDIYAFGCILYEMLSGHRAPKGETITELQISHCDGILRPIPENLPEDLRTLLIKCLALNPTRRYKSWKEIEKVLEHTYAAKNGQPAPQSLISTDLSRDEHIKTGWSYSEIGASYLHIGELDVATGYFEKALTMARELNDYHGESLALLRLGEVYRNLGDMGQAIKHYEECLAIGRNIVNHNNEQAALTNLGSAHQIMGNFQQALAYYEKSLIIAREMLDRDGEASILGNLGLAYRDLDPHQAVEYHEQSLAIFRHIGKRRDEGIELGNLGLAYAVLGDSEKAIVYYEDGLAIAREIGNRSSEGTILVNLGNSYLRLDNPHLAINCFEQVLELEREVGDRYVAGGALSGLGDAYQELGESQRAINYYEQSLAIVREIGNRHHENSILTRLGNLHQNLGDLQQAIEYCEQSLKIVHEIGSDNDKLRLLINLGSIYQSLGDFRRTIEFYEQALAISREKSNRSGETIALITSLGSAYMSTDHKEQAIGHFEQALQIFQELNDTESIATAKYNLATLYTGIGEIDKAILFAQEAMQLWTQISSDNSLIAKKLIDNLTSTEPSVYHAMAALKALHNINSMEEMQILVTRYPFMVDKKFIQPTEQIIKSEVPPEQMPAFEQRLTWLRQIANQK